MMNELQTHPKDYIKKITLLTKKQFEKYADIFPELENNRLFWLQTSYHDPADLYCLKKSLYCYAANNCGCVQILVDNELGVRPALIIVDAERIGLHPGSVFFIGNYTWTMLDYGIALCDDIVGYCCFRKYLNNVENPTSYEDSDIKKWLNNWINTNIFNHY